MTLTDAELRRQLKTHGFNPGPITDTTRNIYLKRLDKLKEEKKINMSKSAKDVRSSSTPISSTTSRGRSKSPVLRSKRITRNSQMPHGYSTDEDQINDSDKILPKARSTRSPKKSTRQSLAVSRDVESTKTTPIHRRVAAVSKSAISSLRSTKKRSSSLQPIDKYSDDSDDESERSSIDSWIEMETAETNTTPSLQRNTRDDQSRLQKFREEIEAWKREEEKMYSKTKKNHHVSNSKSNSNGIPASKVVTQEQHRNNISDRDLQSSHWTLSFSSFLPVGTCIFFIVLGLLYATMKFDPSLNTKQTIGYNSEETANEDLQKTMQGMYDIVASNAGDRICGYKSSNDQMAVSSLTTALNGLIEHGKVEFEPLCRTFVENEYGLLFYNGSKALIEDADRCSEAQYVDAEVPILSGWCRFMRAVQKVLLKIIFTAVVGVAIWLGLVYRRCRSERRREEREQMFIMVQKILDVLRRQYDSCENNDNMQPYLPILHVRDMIIPPKDRMKMANIWERAKQFLSASETRIRVENQTIQGEDYLVWRWIQASSPAKRHTPTSRVWQGEAFDVTRGPMICPTPCLKLRNVFNPNMEVDKNWIEQIQDSILEKCQGNNEILRICVEKDSKEGLVYMLCASNQAAGRAFQALHGAWFDGRLVTVKFIRLHRFHHRFPESVNQSKVPLQPTSEVPVSTILATPSPVEVQQRGRLYPTLPDD